MFELNVWSAFDETATLHALRYAFAVIEFNPNGTIIGANQKYLDLMGYRAAEIVGKHHSLFVLPDQIASPDYLAAWAKLMRGEPVAGEFKRLTKGGAEVWVQASYTPVLGRGGKVRKIVALALDITQAKRKTEDDFNLLAALNRSQAVISFSTDGTILDANENFLAAMGYSADEIKGRKHAMFVDPAFAVSQEYQEFWRRLSAGDFFSAEYRRVGKGGKEVWLQASYNPVFDAKGKVVKVVKFAADLAERMRNVRLMADALARLARGDLQAQVDDTLIPSLDRLRVDFNRAVAALKGAFGEIATAAQVIRQTSSSVSESTEQLSHRTEQQAASLEQTAAALDEITATVRKAAERVTQVNGVVGEAKRDTEVSDEVVGAAVQAMGKIDESSAQIGRIIGVIDEIAFQTNLLALNAGVEAARAGDAGRGFAVVATEVRALAQRSADAAKEIKALINASNVVVASGVKSVGEARQTLDRIASHVGGINNAIGEIAASTREQAEGLGQVNTAVNHMDQMTQQNAAMVEETAAATLTLAQETESIMRLLARFQTGTAPADKPPAAARRALARV
jgi:methyl-accepting chemotaxis protein